MKNFTLFLGFLIACATLSAQTIINVPGDQPNIQAGIGAATDGDTVLVAPDTYYENITFEGKAITLASHFIIDGDTSHISNTVIDGSQPVYPDSASVVRFVNGEDTTSILCGFTITGGTGTATPFMIGLNGGGIHCYNSGAKIIHNRITANSLSGADNLAGGGFGNFITMGEYWAVLEDNLISDNIVSTDGEWANGGGLLIITHARLCNNIIENNQCINNTPESYADGGGVYWGTAWGLDDTVYFRNNIVRNNYCYSVLRARGGGIFAERSHAYITGNQFNNNTVEGDDRSRGAAINYQPISGNVLIENNEFKGNISDGLFSAHGPAVRVINFQPGAELNILDNDFISNMAITSSSASYGTLFLFNGQDNKVVIDGNLFKENQARYAAGIFAQQTYNMAITNNMFIGNSVDYEGGAIHFWENPARGKPSRTGIPVEDMRKGIAEGSSSEMHPLVMNNTFVGNRAKYGGGITNEYNVNVPVLLNNLFWDNEATNSLGEGKDVDNELSDSTIIVAYCNIDVDSITGSWEGKFNINKDPGFLDSTCHLADSSDLINKGIDIYEAWGAMMYCPATDFDGDPRPDTSCMIADIGADEVMVLCTGIQEPGDQSSSLALGQNYPNPFRDHTMFSWYLDSESLVKLAVYDLTGKRVAELVEQKQGRGTHRYEWSSEGLPPGIYFYKLDAGNQSATRKMVLLK